MSLNPFSFIGDIVGKIADKISPDKQKIVDGQVKLNELEISGAPSSNLRLWRSFLGWVASLLFAWEVIGRLIIIPIFFPHVIDRLPESTLPLIGKLLYGMLGIGW